MFPTFAITQSRTLSPKLSRSCCFIFLGSKSEWKARYQNADSLWKSNGLWFTIYLFKVFVTMVHGLSFYLSPSFFLFFGYYRINAIQSRNVCFLILYVPTHPTLSCPPQENSGSTNIGHTRVGLTSQNLCLEFSRAFSKTSFKNITNWHLC